MCNVGVLEIVDDFFLNKSGMVDLTNSTFSLTKFIFPIWLSHQSLLINLDFKKEMGHSFLFRDLFKNRFHWTSPTSCWVGDDMEFD